MDTAGNGLHGAHLRRDLLARWGRHRVASWVRSGELKAIWRDVVVDAARVLEPRTRAAAALLAAGPAAALCGATVLGLAGCTAYADADVHIVLPYEHSFQPRRGLVVHRGRFLNRDAELVDGLRAILFERCLADLLCTLPARDALALADEVLRRAGAGHDELRKGLRERLETRLDPRGTVRGARLLDLADPAAESPPESWLRLDLIERGFPLPEVNWWLRDLDGRQVYRLDLAWPGLRIVVEYDGYEAHAGRESEDAIREAELRRRGWIVIRATRHDLGDTHRLHSELRAAFAARGYHW